MSPPNYGSPQSQDKIWIKLSYKIDFSSFFSSPVFVEYLHASDKLPVPFRRIGQRWEATRAPGKAAEV